VKKEVQPADYAAIHVPTKAQRKAARPDRDARRPELAAQLEDACLAVSRKGSKSQLRCIDLRAAFPSLRIRWSEDHIPSSPRDPWDEKIVCRFGTIYPHGSTRLQALCTGTKTAAKLSRLPCTRVWQTGNSELTVVFEVDDFEAVAEVMRPITKRKGRTAEALAAIRPDLGKCPKSTPESPIVANP
jgi:hypothetical protein